VWIASGIQIRMRKSPDTDATQDGRRGNPSQGCNGYAKRSRCKWWQGDGTDVPAQGAGVRAITNKGQKRKKGWLATVSGLPGTACQKCEPALRKSRPHVGVYSSFWIFL